MRDIHVENVTTKLNVRVIYLNMLKLYIAVMKKNFSALVVVTKLKTSHALINM